MNKNLGFGGTESRVPMIEKQWEAIEKGTFKNIIILANFLYCFVKQSTNRSKSDPATRLEEMK
jgi:hypothetical protein